VPQKGKGYADLAKKNRQKIWGTRHTDKEEKIVKEAPNKFEEQIRETDLRGMEGKNTKQIERTNTVRNKGIGRDNGLPNRKHSA